MGRNCIVSSGNSKLEPRVTRGGNLTAGKMGMWWYRYWFLIKPTETVSEVASIYHRAETREGEVERKPHLGYHFLSG